MAVRTPAVTNTQTHSLKSGQNNSKARTTAPMSNGNQSSGLSRAVAQHEGQQLRHHWRHPKLGERLACCQEMSQATGRSQANFWRYRTGEHSQIHGWVGLDPLHEFQAAQVDHLARISKAAATRAAKNAAESGITAEEYNALTYSQRSRLKQKNKRAA